MIRVLCGLRIWGVEFWVGLTGVGYNMPLLDADISEAKRVFETNVIGIIIAVQAFAPLLIAAKGSGTIINIGSIAGVAPVPWQSVYNASKAAVTLLTDTMRLEMEPLGVKVILVSASSLLTPPTHLHSLSFPFY
jgi:1-acylglycerone phosphate reductase